MKQVDKFIDQKTSITFKPTAKTAHAFKYYTNSIGAATDKSQRINRLAALRTIL